LEEVPSRDEENVTYFQSSPTDPVLRFKNVVLKWDPLSLDPPFLRDLTFELGKGQLLVISGPVGSGKVAAANSRLICTLQIAPFIMLVCYML
jgi:ABC-type uncharacterized transport system fused permease/ATPase subunit